MDATESSLAAWLSPELNQFLSEESEMFSILEEVERKI